MKICKGKWDIFYRNPHSGTSAHYFQIFQIELEFRKENELFLGFILQSVTAYKNVSQELQKVSTNFSFFV